MTTIPDNDAGHAHDPPPGPKGPTKTAVDEAKRAIVEGQAWLFVVQAERALVGLASTFLLTFTWLLGALQATGCQSA